ncbi:MAG: TolC family protein [Chitinophagaceae bacterium]|nr:TolC family protein [Chitinophagaceae bacterium]
MKRLKKKFLWTQLPFAYCLLLIGAFFLNSTRVNAQTPITLQQAIDTALKNNLAIKNERLRTEYSQKLIRSGTIIPATNVFAEYGQMNSAYADTKLGVSQTISFPKIYASQKSLLSEEWKGRVLQVGMQEADLKRLVTTVFFNLSYLQKEKSILQENDSLFAEFLDKATFRFNKGESNILEKTTAENQRARIGLQLAQLQRDWELQQLQFQLLLNTEAGFVPDETDLLTKSVSLVDTGILTPHPSMQYWKQKQDIASANTRAEQFKLLPDLSLGYNLMGMKGLGADDKEYNSSPRFQSFQIGLGIPIFTGGQKARINASKINEHIAANEYEVKLKNFENEYASALKQFQKFDEAVKYFENTALKNAETIKVTANKQFLSGETNYLEWVILINQAISIQSDYIEAVRSRNLAIAELNYYTNQ